MVHIIDSYYVDADENQYILRKDTGRTDKDDKRIYNSLAFTTTLGSALDVLRNRYTREAVAANDCELAEMCEKVRAIDAELKKAIEGKGLF